MKEDGGLFLIRGEDLKTIASLNEKVDRIEKIIQADAANQPGFLTLTKFSKKYEIPKSSLYDWHAKGVITLKKLGGRLFVDINEFEKSFTDVHRKNNVQK